jgi:wobble nucleotide-excising tRNase
MKTITTLGLTTMTLLLLLPPTAGHQSKATVSNKTTPRVPEHCRLMVEQQQQMANTMKMQDLKLKDLVADMDSATGDQKVRALSETVKELILQRTERQEMTSNLQAKKMGHMMQHMEQGAKMPMMQCPMRGSGMGAMGMKGMKK